MSVKLRMDVHVDASKCLAYGTCVGIAPDMFDLPARAKIVVLLKREVSDDEIGEVEEAVRNCPARALSLHSAAS